MLEGDAAAVRPRGGIRINRCNLGEPAIVDLLYVIVVEQAEAQTGEKAPLARTKIDAHSVDAHSGNQV